MPHSLRSNTTSNFRPAVRAYSQRYHLLFWHSGYFDAKWLEKELHKLNRDRNALKRLVKSNRRLTVQDITAKLNECKTKTFSQKTVQRVLHSEGYKRRLAKKKMVVREANRKKRVKWCKERRGQTVDN